MCSHRVCAFVIDVWNEGFGFNRRAPILVAIRGSLTAFLARLAVPGLPAAF
jgi:hypothetical protein